MIRPFAHSRRAVAAVAVAAVSVVCLRGAPLIAADQAEIIKRCKAATALVDVEGFGSGSSFCVNTAGFFITNHHVVRETELGQTVRLVLHSGEENERVLKARVIQTDAPSDLALLKVDGAKGLTVVTLRSTKDLVETMPLTAFGYPFGRYLSRDRDHYPSISVNTGRVSALRKVAGKLDAIQIDAAVNPGNSGGPVIDEAGNVMGVVVSGIFRTGVSFAIPADKVKDFLAKPALVLKKPEIHYADRGRAVKFEVEVIAADPAQQADAVTIEFTADRGRTTKVQGQRSSERFLFEAAPFAQATSAAASRVRLIAYSTTERRVIDLPDAKLRLGKSELPWSEVRTLERRSAAWIVTTLSGQRYAGAIDSTKVPAGQGQSLDLAEVQRVDVAVHDGGPREVAYEIRAQNGGKTVGSLKGTWAIKGSPLRVTDNPYDPRDPLAPNLEFIEIEARVDAVSHLYLRRDGLYWKHISGDWTGTSEGSQRRVTVNGQPWKFTLRQGRRFPDREGTYSDVLPLKIPRSAWEVSLVSIHDGNGQLDNQRGELTCNQTEDGAFVVEFADTGIGAGTYRVRLRRAPGALQPESTPQTPTPEQAAKLKALDEQAAKARQQIADIVTKADKEYEKEPIAPKAEPIAKATAGTTHAEPVEHVWIEDDTPAGARLQGNTPWQFVEKPYPVYSGARSHRRTAEGIAQHFFDSAKDGLQIGEGDRFFTYVYLDPNDPPKEIMLQFFTDGWDRRAFWGEDSIALGVLNEISRRPQGALPKLGEWTRLEVKVGEVGLKPGSVVTGWAFTQNGGTVYWDKAGIVSRTRQVGQPFASQAEWESFARPRTDELPEAVAEAIRVDGAARTPQQSKALRDYFLEHAYSKTWPAVAPLHLELASLGRQRAALEAEIPGGFSFAPFAGKWTVRYGGGAVREYVVEETGRVQFPSESRTGKLLRRDGKWLLDFEDGKLEQVRFLTSHEMLVYHFDPASSLGGSPTLTGIARRRIKL